MKLTDKGMKIVLRLLAGPAGIGVAAAEPIPEAAPGNAPAVQPAAPSSAQIRLAGGDPGGVMMHAYGHPSPPATSQVGRRLQCVMTPDDASRLQVVPGTTVPCTVVERPPGLPVTQGDAYQTPALGHPPIANRP